MEPQIKNKLEQIKLLFDSNAISEVEYNLLKEEILFGGKDKLLQKNILSSQISRNERDKNKSLIQKKQPVNDSSIKKTTSVNKKKDNSRVSYYLGTGVVLIIAYLFIFGKDYSEIKAKYPEGKKFESIDNTSWVLVTNDSKKINIYDENSKRLILNKWYNGDVSGFGITFYEDYDNGVYAGVLINPDEYSKLLQYGDDLVQGKDPESQAEKDKALKEYGEEQDRLNSKSWVVCKNCPGKSCSRCFGRMYYYGKE